MMNGDRPWDFVPCPALGDLINYTEKGNKTRSFGGNITLSEALNLTFPCWNLNEIPRSDPFKRVMDELNVYITPVIIIIGLTGNLMSFLVFTATHLRRQSSSVYLASLAVADFGFLMSLFVIWLSWIKIPILHMEVWCEITVYIGYVCTFLSVWYVVSFTVERYIIVWYPLRKDRFCTRKRARIVVISLALFAGVFYSFATWTSGVVNLIPMAMPVCMPLPQYYHFYTVITGVDFTLTLVFPSTIVIMLNIRIIIKILNVQRQRRPFVRSVNYAVRGRNDEGSDLEQQRCSVHEGNESSGRIVHVKFRSSNNNIPSLDKIQPPGLLQLHPPGFPGQKDPLQRGRSSSKSSSDKHSGDSNIFRKCHTRVHVKNCNQYKTARMLIVVSSVFVILNLPSHVFRIYAFIQNSLSASFEQDTPGYRPHMRWQEIFQLVYHLHFVINFFIYSLYGRQFRTGLRILYSRFLYKFRKVRKLLLARHLTLDDM